jgi:uncharacterized protein (DUF4415 family)
MSIVKRTLDPSKSSEWTAEEQQRFDAIKDEDIDYSDIPELDKEFFRRAERASEFRKEKTRVTMRLDSDVVEWLKQNGRGYQTRANMILRAAMEHQDLS